MILTPAGRPIFVPSVEAQQQVAPVSQGFVLDAQDLRFIFHQIEVAQNHAGGGSLLGTGPNQVSDPQLPLGLRTVDGSFNNLVPGQNDFGKADRLFPRLLTPVYRTADNNAAGVPTRYSQKSGDVIDSQPRIISNLIVDQSNDNPAAKAAATNPCGSGGFVCQGTADPDPDSGALFIPNITPDFGLSAPFNLMFAFFGQFFDHGLDLVTKGGSGNVVMPLRSDDPLFNPATPETNFMVMARGQNQPGPDGILGTADDIQEGTNTTTPWVDQNQTYTSHPAHQVFLRQYVLDANGKPAQTGKVLDGEGHCAQRPTGISGDLICNIGNWAEVKAQAATKLGIHLTDHDVFDVPLILTDPYGHFKPGPHGFPQLILPGSPNVLVEGDPAANGGAGIDIPVDAFRTGHAFLNDIAHNAVPNAGLRPDDDQTTTDFRTGVQQPGTYDDELLGLHFVTGDGRGNENIGLSMVHQIFHSEHNRLAHDVDRLVSGRTGAVTDTFPNGDVCRTDTILTRAECVAWHRPDPARPAGSGSGWDYGERLFQAARFGTEMQYQHLVFEEFARTIQPLINPFLGGLTSIDAAISAEFAHTVYRLGHSMLPEVLGRKNVNGSTNNIRLLNAFLNPVAYNDGGPAGQLTADKAAGALVRGLSEQVGNELDEFVTSSVRNTLVGLPLDLPAINIARGRSEGIPSLNEARRQFFAVSHDTAVKPYTDWFDFGNNLKHRGSSTVAGSLVNFIAAYGTHPSILAATTLPDKRAAAKALVDSNDVFMFSDPNTSGLNNVDFWVGGLAEKQAVFGGLLGPTFNFVFETQLEHLQDGDRFYYLQRLDGLNLKTQLEGNSFAELLRRNTDFKGGMDVIFKTADANLSAADFSATPGTIVRDGVEFITLPDGTLFFFDPLHTGKNIVFNGSDDPLIGDKFKADVGDDTLYGNGGNDRLDGFEGNDTIHGGNGDDVLLGGNGDDVLKGGPGNDAMQSGPGFGADLSIGGDGNDFMVGGDDGVEYFGGPGNDIIVDGSMRSEAMLGGSGDDWIFDGDGHDGGIFGDEGNVFDLLAGLSAVGGDDVEGGGPGQDNHFGEGGNDIFLMSEGSNKFFGDYGFDWVTLRAWPQLVRLPNDPNRFWDIELGLLANPLVNLNFNDTRNVYRFVDGASGWDLDDHIAGSNNVLCDPAAAEVAECLIVGMELTAAGASRIDGLTDLMAAFRKSLTDPAIPGIKGVGFMGGDILLGGRGSDTLMGKNGDDLIDGDVWLNVQLEATLRDPVTHAITQVKRVNSPVDLVDDVFANPQRLNPGDIRIIREIVTPAAVPADCGTATPRNCDIAVFQGPISEYTIDRSVPGIITVIDNGSPVGNPNILDGTDTLRNIELLQFADVTVPASGAALVVVPNVVGATQTAATDTVTAAALTPAVSLLNSATIAIGLVISQTPIPGTSVSIGTAVTLFVSRGALVPNVVLATPAAAATTLATAGLTLGTVSQAPSATIPLGAIISQNPAAGTNAAPGSAVAVTVSLGPANVVPNVVAQPRAAATTAITSVGLTVGTVTFANNNTIPAGSIVSTTPVAGTTLAAGGAVNLVVSLGTEGLVVAFGFDEPSGTVANDSSVVNKPGTIREALHVPGKFGGALQFDGVNDWVTMADTTASPIDLTNGMTLEAWVNPSAQADWDTIILKERGASLSYALYAYDGAPQPLGTNLPAGYVNVAGVDGAVRGLAPLPLNTWTHLAMTYNGSVQRLFVNGVEVSSRAQTGNLSVANGALRIGGNTAFPNEFYKGLIDEVRIYNRARTAAQITTDMNTPIVR